MRNYILDIQKMSTEDGPGIRTTVFFKGCNLRCGWCHNPESLSFEKEIYWQRDHCIACFTCVEVCPEKAISFGEKGWERNQEKCRLCLTCQKECPANAIVVKGEELTVDELLRELLKDLSYYQKSGGGVTLSGGEAALHNDYVFEILRKLKEAGAQTALDTAGNYPYELLERLLPHLDMILYDLKIYDDGLHRRHTGVGNGLILENARKIGKIDHPKVWIRTPIIPGATDGEENIENLGKFIKENMPNIEKWELLSFNNLSKNKYRLLGKVWEYENEELLTKEKMENLCRIARRHVENVVWSGATKLEV